MSKYFLFVFLVSSISAIPKQEPSKSEVLININTPLNKNHTQRNETNLIKVDINLCPSQCYGHGKYCFDNGNGIYKCYCNDGFYGLECQYFQNLTKRNENNINKCPNNCSGKGICQIKNWTCQCDLGYEGDDCSRISLEKSCEKYSNCSGKGKCIEIISKAIGNKRIYKCKCFEGFEGDDCSKALKICDCRHGVCEYDSGKPICKCENGFSGEKCDKYDPFADECYQSLGWCSGRGICTSISSSSFCSCIDHYDSPSCGIISSPSCPSSCSGNGMCSDITNECTCNTGISGASCNISLCDFQITNQCSGHGLCKPNQKDNNTTIYECSCMNGYIDSKCETKQLDYWAECPNLCGGHGYCAQTNTGHVCVCDKGWTGSDCSQDLISLNCCRSPIDPNQTQCMNNGACVSCKCNCFTGFKGEYCDQQE